MFLRRINLFSDKINIKKVSEPIISPRYTRNFGTNKDSFSTTDPLHILHIYQQTSENVSKRAFQQAGGALFLSSEMQYE